MPVIAANGIDIAYDLHKDDEQIRCRGSHSYIVLINGLADEKETWLYQIPSFVQAGFQVLSFDNRGVGSSSKPAGPYSAALLAADAKALVDSLALGPFHLMGVSMGGMIAQQYAIDYASDLLSLTLACTYATPGPFCSRMFSMWADAAPIMGVPFVMRDVTLWAFTQDFFNNRQDELHEIESAMRFMTMSTPAYLAQLAVIQNFDSTQHLPNINAPTLVLAGEEDILIPVGLSQKIHALIPKSQWKTVPGGHGFMWEHPEPFNRAFLEFLQRVEKGDQGE